MFVTHRCESWDFLLDVDAEPKRVPAAMCATSARRNPAPLFLNRPALDRSAVRTVARMGERKPRQGEVVGALWQSRLYVGQAIAGRYERKAGEAAQSILSGAVKPRGLAGANGSRAAGASGQFPALHPTSPRKNGERGGKPPEPEPSYVKNGR